MAKSRIFLVIACVVTLCTVGAYTYARPYWMPVYHALMGKQSLQSVIDHYGLAARDRLNLYFQNAGANYPPSVITLLAIKAEKKVELWVEEQGKPVYIRAYEVKAASGELGPKLREGDRQVPEGIYQLEYLNPNSAYHLSMKLNYPNAFDRKHAAQEGRMQPGTNIFIHGKAVSIGCLAMGDEAIEELFVLVADTGKGNVTVAIAPMDPRNGDILFLAENKAAWISELYRKLTNFYQSFTSEQ